MTKKELLELLKDVPDDGLIVVETFADRYRDCVGIEARLMKKISGSQEIVNNAYAILFD